MDQLCEVPKESLPGLRDLYNQDWPQNYNGYCLIDNYIRWFEIQPEIENLKIYCLNGDWTDGTFVIVDRYQLFLHSLAQSNDRLIRALKLLDWSRGYKVCCYLNRHHPAVMEAVMALGLNLNEDCKTYLYHLRRAQTEVFNNHPPPNVVMRSLSPDDVVIAESVWPNRHCGSLFFLKRLAKFNTSVGAFDHATGQLMAWTFHQQPGTMGALQVMAGFERRGLGSLVTRELAKKLADIGRDTLALVDLDNEASIGMFEKLGFKRIDLAYVSWVLAPGCTSVDWID